MAFRRRSKAVSGVDAARGIIEDPQIRRAAAQAAQPVARLGVSVGKRVARKKTQAQIKQLSEVISTLSLAASTYGPQLIRQLGLVEEPPKPKRVAPRFLAGALLGAGMMYVLEPQHGHEHRQWIQSLVSN